LHTQSNPNNYDDEIDLKELFFLIWNAKILIICATILSFSYGVYYLQNAEQEYSATIKLKKVNETNSATLMGEYAQIAFFLGKELKPSSTLDFDTFLNLLTSQEVAERIYQNTELVKELFRGEIDKETNSYIQSPPNYVSWLKKKIKFFITGQNIKPYMPPNSRRVMLLLKTAFSVSVDTKTGFLILSGETSRPDTVIDLMENAIKISDNLVRERYISESISSINFYQQKIARVKSKEHREELAALIVVEENKLMLATSGKNYVVEVISQPQISLYPTSPNTTLVLGLSILLGILSGVLIALIKDTLRRRR
jgi:LPS O-antigen subunit length determinant protein (WzzB/FepE family)